MVLEVTGFGQLELGFLFIFLVSFLINTTAAGAVEMWESGGLGPDFQARWKGWETRSGSFPRFPRGGISTASLECSERRDAAGRVPAASP
jgi:hypothetical protein